MGNAILFKEVASLGSARNPKLDIKQFATI